MSIPHGSGICCCGHAAIFHSRMYTSPTLSDCCKGCGCRWFSPQKHETPPSIATDAARHDPGAVVKFLPVSGGSAYRDPPARELAAPASPPPDAHALLLAQKQLAADSAAACVLFAVTALAFAAGWMTFPLVVFAAFACGMGSLRCYGLVIDQAKHLKKSNKP